MIFLFCTSYLYRLEGKAGKQMATFKRFEDILAWQKAREVTELVYQLSNQGLFAKDYGLRDQIRRSSMSMMANIAEGYGRRSDKSFRISSM